jgi:hypothetical protein
MTEPNEWKTLGVVGLLVAGWIVLAAVLPVLLPDTTEMGNVADGIIYILYLAFAVGVLWSRWDKAHSDRSGK